MAHTERHISQEAYEFAEIYQSGTPEAEYYVSDILPMPRALSCFLILSVWCIVLIFIFVSLPRLVSPADASTFFGLQLELAIGFGIICSLVARGIMISARKQYFRLYSYTKGLVRHRIGDNRIDAFRWEQIETVWRRVATGYDRDQEQLIKDCFYIIELVDGTRWRMRGHADLQEIGHMCEGIILEKKLPKTIAAYDAGNTITFGELSLNLRQVGNGKETLTWDEIARIDVTEYGINVIPWEYHRQFSLPIEKTPNVCVFENLLRHIEDIREKNKTIAGIDAVLVKKDLLRRKMRHERRKRQSLAC